MAEATAVLIQSRGLEVRIASTGWEALALVVTFQPDVILCDMTLPDMSGLDLATSLRATPSAKDALIAIYSAMTESDLRLLGCDNASVNVYLSKPLTENKLDVLLSGLDARNTPHPHQLENR